MQGRRVVVTGLGVVTPVGIGVEESWQAWCRGESGIRQITRFDVSDFPVKIAGEVVGFDPGLYIEKKEIKKMDLFIQYAMAAGTMAMKDSGLQVNGSNAEQVGVLVGCGLGGLPSIERYHHILEAEGYRKISPFFIPMMIGNMASGYLSMRFGLKGPNSCVSTACATGAHAIGDAFKIIAREDADAMLAGGAEGVITPLGIGAFANMRALSTRNDEPPRASRPFDRDRDGFVMGEGAGVVMLEALDCAKARGARIYAEIVGYGMSSDAYHVTMPDPKGDGASRCMARTLKDAGVRPEEVDYINAHGTSTPYNDKFETIAIKNVFGEHAYKLAVSSTKSMIGHLLGAAGGVEAVATVLSVKHGIITPTINYENPDPECDLDYVPNEARRIPIRLALSNSFGFGGTNASVLFKRYTE
ncbi:MAG: beta-ketoacyl-ACP synthase II [Candidatus Tectomicrobia bacterium]|uniref:3-oxoacyl-[acyl-carrier-protein] synthase 2 n=1 Tax=Tectimicrobiota bacterium TaxID=2528274 RepID=A0A932M268_UNCTE|nr:beta-ketoacyl-ACP synthase II [Candidatus Tectomicrobia bacterium]